MWVAFVVGSVLALRGVFPGYSGFSPPTKANILKFHLVWKQWMKHHTVDTLSAATSCLVMLIFIPVCCQRTKANLEKAIL